MHTSSQYVCSLSAHGWGLTREVGIASGFKHQQTSTGDVCTHWTSAFRAENVQGALPAQTSAMRIARKLQGSHTLQ